METWGLFLSLSCNEQLSLSLLIFVTHIPVKLSIMRRPCRSTMSCVFFLSCLLYTKKPKSSAVSLLHYCLSSNSPFHVLFSLSHVRSQRFRLDVSLTFWSLQSGKFLVCGVSLSWVWRREKAWFGAFVFLLSSFFRYHG
jgi:hypothetical protein